MAPSGKLLALTPTQLATWVDQIRPQAQRGQLPTYIPNLAQVDPTWLAIALQPVKGPVLTAGEVEQRFCLMSVIKPLLLLFLLEHLGAATVWRYVGMEPSAQPFNSLVQLEADHGWPRNPMLNSGAITLASLLPGGDAASRCERLQQWLNHLGDCDLRLDTATLTSVRQAGNPQNRAIAQRLAWSGHLAATAITALNTYNQICCLQATVTDLARLGLVLACGHPAIQMAHRQMVNALMLTCGLYEASGEFAVRLGIPTKSGVSGALLSVVPGEGAIAIYSPALDATGNSVAGLALLECLVQQLQLSIFS